MFAILKKYSNANKFEFGQNERLSEVCNAPTDRSGVYLVFDSSDKSKMQLLYIGRSGEMKDGVIKHRKDGLYGRLVKGKQFDEPRRQSWPKKMKEEGIFCLSVVWVDTENDDPEEIEDRLLSEAITTFGGIPIWNSKGPNRFYSTSNG